MKTAHRAEDRRPGWPRVVRRAGFTRPDAVVVCLACALLFALCYAATERHIAPRISRMGCANHLKIVGLAFLTFAVDHSDTFPMGLSTNAGGTLEWAPTDQVFRHFRAISNEVGSPDFLTCVEHRNRGASRAPDVAHVSNEDLDYFVGVDARSETAADWLAGDKFLTTDARREGALYRFDSNTVVDWKPKPHAGKGYLLTADGAVRSFSSTELVADLRTNLPFRVAIP